MTQEINDIIATLEASAARRIVGCGALYGVGGLMLYAIFTDPLGLRWNLVIVAMAIGVFVLAEKLRRATQGQIILRADGLSDANGQTLAYMCDIERVERGAFAFKPSNGFTLKLKKKQPRGWAPGLWWRYGRYLGVGGAVSAIQTKFMAEQIAFALAQRASDVTEDD